MDVAALCPLEVGVLRWRAPTPAISLIVKATWTIDLERPGAPVRLAERQEPVSGDVGRRQRGGDDELRWASDFVPYKPRADVVLAGHARAASAATVLPVRLALEGFERVVYAVSADPVTQVPLLPSHLRTTPRDGAPGTGVGPSPGWVARPLFQTGGAGADLIGPSGILRGAVPPDFDFAAFNVAPVEQQIEMLRGDEEVTLEGVGPGGAPVVFRLAGVLPRVFLADGGGAPTQELAVACDTLAIDVDRRVCITVWRGALVLDPERAEPALVVVAAQNPGDVLDWPMVLGNIFAARALRATEPSPEGDEAALPKFYDDEEVVPTIGRWSDESTTRVRDEPSSRGSAPRAGSEPEGETRRRPLR